LLLSWRLRRKRSGRAGMPPRRSARVAAVVERQTSALAPLPYLLVLAIFSLLPVDQRLRCAEVCRGWRAVLSDVSLWLRLDCRLASGLARFATDGLLRAAAARAAGQLQALDLSDGGEITQDASLAVLRANADTLREFSTFSAVPNAGFLPFEAVEAAVRAAPLLRVYAADVTCTSVEQARLVLQHEGFGLLFRALRCHRLQVVAPDADEASVLVLAAGAASCETLTELVLDGLPLGTAAALDAVVAAALARRLSAVQFWVCNLGAASLPALARLLGGGALRTLALCCADDIPLLHNPANAALFRAALRANTALTSLLLTDVALWHEDAAASALLGVLTGHPSLRLLDVSYNGRIVAAVAAALGALVAANAPALQELDVSGEEVAEEGLGLGPLFDVLPRNTHLRVLTCVYDPGTVTVAFVRERLLPAVRVNTSLRTLAAVNQDDDDDEYEEGSEAHDLLRVAQAFVAARAKRMAR
jgi:hypothetical protein